MSEAKRAAADAKPKRPIRDNLDALGIAILFAVLLKPLVIEAYQIPTPSMQPTMMGSKEAGVHDRLLVDKLRYALTEPKRWDISVFRYPIRENQNYVKRIVGMPAETLRIGCGNIYTVGPEGPQIQRRPDRIQAGLWKEIYPLRREIVGGSEVLGTYFTASPRGQWKEDGEDLVVTISGSRTARLTFTNPLEGGLSNQVYDGYPVGVAAVTKTANGQGASAAVQDARFSFTLTPAQTPASLVVDLQRTENDSGGVTFALHVEGGQGRLSATREGTAVATSEPFDFALPAGSATEVSFAHLDDRLIARRNGDIIAELECSATALLRELPPGSVVLRLSAKGGGELRFADLRVERDLHYTTTGLSPTQLAQGIVIPAEHYLMLGDNTLQSADARQWRVFTIGVLPDGRMVDPDRHPDARKLRGNVRPWPLDQRPDPDENPVVVQTLDRVAFTDELGEVFALRSAISNAYGAAGSGSGEIRMMFRELDEQGKPTDHEWTPKIEKLQFVHRDDLLGRPVLGFWPIWPLAPNRVGFIR